MQSQPLILIADDQAAVREALRILLAKEGYQVALATSPKEVLQTLQTSEVALVMLDLNYARDTTSGQEGLDLIAQIKKIEGAPPIVGMPAGTPAICTKTLGKMPACWQSCGRRLIFRRPSNAASD